MKFPEHPYTLLFKDPSINVNRAMRMTPDGGLTGRKIFAAMLEKDRAEEIAVEVRANFPKATVTVKPF